MRPLDDALVAELADLVETCPRVWSQVDVSAPPGEELTIGWDPPDGGPPEVLLRGRISDRAEMRAAADVLERRLLVRTLLLAAGYRET